VRIEITTYADRIELTDTERPERTITVRASMALPGRYVCQGSSRPGVDGWTVIHPGAADATIAAVNRLRRLAGERAL